MYCPHCGSSNLKPRTDLTPGGYKRFQCNDCGKRCNSRTVLQRQPQANEDEVKTARLLDLEKRIEALQRQNRELRGETLDTTRLRDLILKVSSSDLKPPAWTVSKKETRGSYGTPTLFLSDLHWGERVFPAQVNHVNEYNLPIARKRLQRVFEKTVSLLTEQLRGGFDGFVLPLGGDMISGNIHDEIRETNDDQVLACIMDLLEHLIAGIDLLADKFGRVFIPCVVGNHGRLDRKPRAKGAVRDNFEWILYQFLAKHYQEHPDVNVVVSESLDYRYRLHNTVYMLTHGDQFRGGTGISGPMTPWALGDHRKRKRQDAIGQPYDMLIFGHWHQLFWGGRSFLCNGSLKGYDEYAFRQNFPFEPPQQALWITHPKRGATIQMPVHADAVDSGVESAWVSLADMAA